MKFAPTVLVLLALASSLATAKTYTCKEGKVTKAEFTLEKEQWSAVYDYDGESIEADFCYTPKGSFR